MIKDRFINHVRIFGTMISAPKHTGAVAPTSRELAQRMASHIDVNSGMPVLELGPGTGAITKYILERGLPQERLTCIEYEPKFVRSLRGWFPRATILEGDAFDLCGTLGQKDTIFDCVISGMPLLNFEVGKRNKLLVDCLDRIPNGRPFVQFSYGVKAPIEIDDPAIEVTRSSWVLKNLPPARVWTYRRVK